MKILTKQVETYEVSDEVEVQALIQETRDEANGQYTLDYKSKLKEITSKAKENKGEVIDRYWIVELTKKMTR